MQIRIAVVQFEIEQFAPEKNLAHAEEFIREAALQGAQLVVFPEDFLTGPLLGKVEWADATQRYRKFFQLQAAQHRIDIVPGSIIERDGTGLYNTTYYIDHTGQILGTYRKVNLWCTERSYLTPGRQAAVCNTRFGKVGLAICWDLAFPELFRTMLAQGTEIVVCPSYWAYEDAGMGLAHASDSEVRFVNALCTARAFEQNVALVFANAAGQLQTPEAACTLLGHSQITVPFKGPLQRLEHSREAMFVQTVDTTVLADAEIVYGIRSDLKKGLTLRPVAG